MLPSNASEPTPVMSYSSSSSSTQPSFSNNVSHNSSISSLQTTHISIQDFFKNYWRSIVVVVAFVVLIILFFVLYNSKTFNVLWNGLFTSSNKKMVLPRANNVSVVASEKKPDKYYTKQSEPTVSAPLTLPPPRPDLNPTSPSDEEVFNVSNNIYTYEDAPAVCQVFDAKLATAKQVQNAFNDGADWCNYGWTNGQLALYPTQKKTFNKLQKLKGHEHDCGIVGVNGGYFQNPDLQFGVNCYGKKPKPSIKEKELIGYFPDYVSEKEKRLQERVAQIKQNISELSIKPFNSTNWDEQRTIPERIEDWFTENE